jgi:hypothetical protein
LLRFISFLSHAFPDLPPLAAVFPIFHIGNGNWNHRIHHGMQLETCCYTAGSGALCESHMIGIHNHVISFMNHACEKMSDTVGNGEKDDAS